MPNTPEVCGAAKGWRAPGSCRGGAWAMLPWLGLLLVGVGRKDPEPWRRAVGAGGADVLS